MEYMAEIIDNIELIITVTVTAVVAVIFMVVVVE